MKIKMLNLTGVILVMFILVSCGTGSTSVTPDLDSDKLQGNGDNPTVIQMQYGGPFYSDSIASKQATIDSIAGQHINVGSLSVTMDDLGLVFEMNTVDGWLINETHIDVVNDPSEFPMTQKGNPKVGHFDIKDELDPPAPTYFAHYDLMDWSPGDVFFIAAHADVWNEDEGEEGCWAAGEGFPGKNWATYFSYEVPED